MLLKRIKKTIEEHQLFQRGDQVLVGVSAGLDSITLLETLYLLRKDWDLKIFVSHYDHKIRKDSYKDALFVYQLCKERGLPFFCTAAPVSKYAKREGLSLEMAGRELRYSLWYSLAKKQDFQKIALAHHLDDLIEEVFLKLIRGTGKRGLAGIPIKREDLIVRPFLMVSRDDIRAFAKERGLSWREDPTNFDLRIPRNKIRHHLIPYLKKNFNPRIRETLKRNILLLSEEEEFIESQALESYQSLKSYWEEDLVLRVQELKKLSPVLRRRVYFLAFKDSGIPLFRITSKHLFAIDSLVTKQNKGPVYLPGKFLAYRGPGYLRLTRKLFTIPYFELEIPKEGTYSLPQGNIEVSIIPNENRPAQSSTNFQLSCKENIFPFLIRKRKPGDRVYFPGLGHKKLKKYLQEKKIPLYLRDRLLVIEKDNQIIGVWNVYIHPNYLIREDTKKVLLLQIFSQD
ncbi:MAG: tRNA lysidine(34) synthetase TilS [Caldimicrobium sp.]|nr:tRNA lysidine(34) synthetase TilS [Caldimicrobium sp.]MCX7613324.1 tRNA lysidine(34) synthetase TilS [Caldimicrobium sp.]MDW8183395.1 tRNA lysidine(34) synthetase TilS [Caldimicrobium sp.]